MYLCSKTTHTFSAEKETWLILRQSSFHADLNKSIRVIWLLTIMMLSKPTYTLVNRLIVDNLFLHDFATHKYGNESRISEIDSTTASSAEL